MSCCRNFRSLPRSRFGSGSHKLLENVVRNGRICYEKCQGRMLSGRHFPRGNTHGLPGASHRFPNAEIGRSRFLFVTGAQEISEAFARKRSARSGQLPRVNSIVINFNFAIEQERSSARRSSEFFHLVDDSRGRVHRVRRVLDYFQNFSFTIRDAVGGGIVSTQG